MIMLLGQTSLTGSTVEVKLVIERQSAESLIHITKIQAEVGVEVDLVAVLSVVIGAGAAAVMIDELIVLMVKEVETAAAAKRGRWNDLHHLNE
jgi:hypothetical protein